MHLQHQAEALKTIDTLNWMAKHSYVAPYNIAVDYAGLGVRDEALRLLAGSYQERSYLLLAYLSTDARLDCLRSDTRLVELRRKVGLPKVELP